jgi:hypothetical protein
MSSLRDGYTSLKTVVPSFNPHLNPSALGERGLKTPLVPLLHEEEGEPKEGLN